MITSNASHSATDNSTKPKTAMMYVMPGARVFRVRPRDLHEILAAAAVFALR
jgi:hypothetical protein